MTESEELIWNKFWVNVKIGNYVSLNSYESSVIRSIHIKNIISTFGHDGSKFAVPIKLNGIDFISSYTRTVIGNHGPYIEFTPESCKLPLNHKSGEEFRINADKAKYLWLEPIINNQQIPIKIYHQKNTVKYADYVPGLMYVCPYELFSTKLVPYIQISCENINLL